jgi:hypothetical protein
MPFSYNRAYCGLCVQPFAWRLRHRIVGGCANAVAIPRGTARRSQLPAWRFPRFANPRRIGYRSAMGAPENASDAWNPGLKTQAPKEWRSLATIFRPENVSRGLAAAEELRSLTGLSMSELVVFRPQRLALHELLIRVSADFVVPDGSRIGDLGINFRKIAGRVLTGYVDPKMDAIAREFDEVRRRVTDGVDEALSGVVRGAAPAAFSKPRAARWLKWPGARGTAPPAPAQECAWKIGHIAECERRAAASGDPTLKLSYRTLARVLAGLFNAHGDAWGTRDLIVPLTRDIACNTLASDAIGRLIDPILRQAAEREGYGLLPRQDRPIVINTKGASASGKSTLRPLQKRLAGEIGASWSDFALISPDIWRKQLLDYASLGDAYKYAGAFTGEELRIVDRKLDRYMAQKFAEGRMSHLLIDRFRFDSFAPDSDEEGSNLLTRFGQTVYLFFVITPPEQLVERAWKRGLEFGRYKAVDDTLAHSVDAYTGIPSVFFTWVRRGDKQFHFEFLDNTVPLGERPRTVAFGNNDTANVLDVGRMLDIDRFGRVFVDATSPDMLYPDRGLLAAERNLGFLRRCIEGFRCVNFAAQTSGRVYLRIEGGVPVWIDPVALQAAFGDPDTRIGVRALAGDALESTIARADQPQYLMRAGNGIVTLGVWGEEQQAPSGEVITSP